MGGRPWTDAELATLKTLAPTATQDDLTAALPGRSWAAIDSKIDKLGAARATGPPQDHAIPSFENPPDDPIDVLAWVDRAAERVKLHKPKGKARDYHRVVIETDTPIAVMYTADIHFGGLDVDYQAFRAHVRFLLDVPGFYSQLVGDIANFMIGHKVAATRRDIMEPEEQFEFTHNFLHQLVDAGKLLSANSGNHDDEFSERTVGFGILKVLAAGKVPYFRGHGYLDLVLRNSAGEEFTYPMGLAHKTRFHSFMNPLHGAKRMEQLHAELFGADRPICRVYVTAHTHYPALATEGLIPQDRIILVKTGTFKTDCTYSQRYFGQGRIGVPTIVFHADRQEHIGFPTPWEAYRYMSGSDYEEAP